MTGDGRRTTGDGLEEGQGTKDEARNQPSFVILSEAKDLLLDLEKKADPSPSAQDDKPFAPEDDQSITRRRALQVLGAVPASLALGILPEQQQQPLTPHVTPTPPPATPAQPRAGVAAPQFFNAHEWKTVRMLADYVIPRDERSGSATDARVPEHMDFLLSDKEANPNAQIAMRGGLAWLDTECRRRFAKDFIDAGDAQRREVLDDIAWPRKAKPEMSHGVAFFNRFRDMTAAGFFSSAIGWKDLQYMGNVFNPNWNGCPPDALRKLDVSYDLMQTRVSPQSK
jgi:gluconate 2-dehydrogenase gamma chain